MIYLIRHAHALPDERDSLRPLSEKGWLQIRDLCSVLRQTPFDPAEFWHSPLVRARETAALLAAGLGLSVPVIEVAGLQPDDDPRRIAKRLVSESRSIAVVGHEPHLSILASGLVHGLRSGQPFAFAKAGVLALRRDGEFWRSEWLHRSP